MQLASMVRNVSLSTMIEYLDQISIGDIVYYF